MMGKFIQGRMPLAGWTCTWAVPGRWGAGWGWLKGMADATKLMPSLPDWRNGIDRFLGFSWSLGRSASCCYTHNNRCDRNDDSSPLNPFRSVIMSVGEEKSAKLNNNKLFEHERRADGTLFVSHRTCSRHYNFSRFVYWLLLFDFVSFSGFVLDRHPALL